MGIKTIKERVYNNLIYPVFKTGFAGMDNSSIMTLSSGISSGGVGIGGLMARFD